MVKLIKELKRVRRLAEQLDDGLLLYLLDVAIVEASEKAGVLEDKIATPKKLHGTTLAYNLRAGKEPHRPSLSPATIGFLGGDDLDGCRSGGPRFLINLI